MGAKNNKERKKERQDKIEKTEERIQVKDVKYKKFSFYYPFLHRMGHRTPETHTRQSSVAL